MYALNYSRLRSSSSSLSYIRSLSTLLSSSGPTRPAVALIPSRPTSYPDGPQFNRSLAYPSYHLRSFSSSNNFNDVINKMKEEYNDQGEKISSKTTNEGNETKSNEQNEAKNEETINEPKETQENVQSNVDYGQLLTKTYWKTKDLASSFITGVKETWKEMIEGPKESKVRKTVAYAEATKAKKVKNEDEDEEDEPAPYTGPTAVVVSKTKRNTWEEMAARLENSPLIREMLKNTRKIGRQAASTDIGKQAKKIGEEVTNKIHVRRYVIL